MMAVSRSQSKIHYKNVLRTFKLLCKEKKENCAADMAYVNVFVCCFYRFFTIQNYKQEIEFTKKIVNGQSNNSSGGGSRQNHQELYVQHKTFKNRKSIITWSIASRALECFEIDRKIIGRTNVTALMMRENLISLELW